MTEPPTPLSHELRVPRGRQLRHSDSPTRQRGTDDLLSNLTPRAAVEAFRNPTGTLKACMDSATPAEQAFALRAAVASKNIQEWLDELVAWPWQTGGMGGFEMPAAKRRRLSRSDTELSDPDSPSEAGLPDKLFCGGLLAADVARYERRINEITQNMEELDVEEIKTQVLHNHIMPLSRPGTPILDSGRSMASLTAFAMMDDLTALITATLMQALPNLSRLTRLMNIWSVRLLVLRRVPVFLTSLADAEIALQSGWNAINSSSKPTADASPASPTPGLSTLSRKEFEVMKSILERKVAKAGRDLDAMLDMLEGWEDTLPEHWLDRVDALERQYGEWNATSEKKVREAEWAKSMRVIAPPVVESKPESVPEKASKASSTNGASLAKREDEAVSPTDSVSVGSEPSLGNGDFSQAVSEPSETATSFNASLRPRDESPTPVIKVLPPDEPVVDTSEYILDEDVDSDKVTSNEDAVLDTFDGPPGGREPSNSKLPDLFGDEDWPKAPSGDELRPRRSARDLDFEDSSDDDVPEPELPTLPRSRRDSDISNPSTVIRGLRSDMDFSSDQLEHGTPELPRLRDSDLRVIPSDDLSPDNSPQAFRSSTRSVSVSFNDMPTVAEISEDSSNPRTPLQSSFMIDEDTSREVGSPGKASVSSADDQLQQQISEILESVPAKIRLAAEPSTINLNPPDFKMPTRKVSKPDLNPRSHSSLSTVSTMSSRAGTPSFTLAPAYNRNNRARHQRGGNQEIKLYHLSRSNGEAPIKLFIRCVGEHGERVMVRVGGGWADLGEYLKEYASHHGRRGGQSKVEIKDIPNGRANSTPPTRPQSAQDSYSPVTPLHVRKARRSAAAEDATALAHSKLAAVTRPDGSSSGGSPQSRSSSRLSWAEEDSSLGMAGPRAKQIEMSEESKAWVQSVKEKVRIASGERKVSDSAAVTAAALMDGKFGEMGKVGATKRLFRKQ
ncbi:hypothetical protein OQA88_1876 [Cercophora sp. LCS_1]